jgi:hypothetical protein
MKTPEVPKGIHAAFPANISEYITAVGRKGSQTGEKRRLKTTTKARRSKNLAEATKARSKQTKRSR